MESGRATNWTQRGTTTVWTVDGVGAFTRSSLLMLDTSMPAPHARVARPRPHARRRGGRPRRPPLVCPVDDDDPLRGRRGGRAGPADAARPAARAARAAR